MLQILISDLLCGFTGVITSLISNDFCPKPRMQYCPHHPISKSVIPILACPVLCCICVTRIIIIFLNYFSLREYPPVTSDEQRQAYKRDFDAELQEYRGLQAELEEIKEELRYLDKELDEYNEDTEEYKVFL